MKMAANNGIRTATNKNKNNRKSNGRTMNQPESKVAGGRIVKNLLGVCSDKLTTDVSQLRKFCRETTM